MFNEWKFHNPKTIDFANSMSALDQTNFGFDCSTLSWDPYFLSMVVGVRRYLVKEHPRSLQSALRKQQL